MNSPCKVEVKEVGFSLNYVEQSVEVAMDIHRTHPNGDILIFLAGTSDINEGKQAPSSELNLQLAAKLAQPFKNTICLLLKYFHYTEALLVLMTLLQNLLNLNTQEK